MNGRRGYYQKFKRIGKKLEIKYLHTMVRVKDLEKSIAFYNLLGLKEIKRNESEMGRFTLVFLAPDGQHECPLELTFNWDGDDKLPSRDGRMAFVRSPDNISIELLQCGEALEPSEPWTSMPNIGHW